MGTAPTRPLSESLKGYGRGIVGGLLFAFAPLYTMEIWWQGFYAAPVVILFAVVMTYAVLVAYAHYAGLHDSNSLPSNMLEALESLAMGFLVAAVVLLLLGQLPMTASVLELVTRLTIEGLTCAIGVAVGSTQLGRDPNESQSGGSQQKRGFVHEVAYSILGATLIVAGLTPTIEIVTVALETEPWAALGTGLLSFLLALGVVSYFNFRGTQRLSGGSIYAGGPLGDALVTYSIGLVVSAVLLWSVGRFDGLGLSAALSMIVYLGWPATLGASVGRLIL